MKKMYWLLVAVIVIAGVAYFKMGNNPISNFVSYTTSSPSPSSSAKTVAKAKPKVTPAVPVSAAAYTDIVKQYTDRRIQFDERCQTTPQVVTFKNNTSVLLDNRSPSARIITVGGVKYSLAGYGYKVITLSSSSLPKELSLDCGASYNVGKILLQAKIY